MFSSVAELMLPTLAATQTTNLVLNDKVFALVGALGTATHSKAYTAAQLAKNNGNKEITEKDEVQKLI